MITDGNNGMVMPVGPMYGMYGGGNGSNGLGDGGWSSWILLFLIAMMFGNNGWGNNGGNGGGSGSNGSFPWLLAGNSRLDDNVQAGFNQAATASQLGDIQNAVTQGFHNAEVADCNRALTQLQTEYQNVIAQNTQMANLSASLQNCCCENRQSIADLKATILSEGCNNRSAFNAGIQSIKDQLCQDKIDAKNEKIADLERQLTMANLAASQIAQTAQLRAGQNEAVNALYDRLATCPVGTMPVYGSQPIFTCPNNNGCGCNGGNF